MQGVTARAWLLVLLVTACGSPPSTGAPAAPSTAVATATPLPPAVTAPSPTGCPVTDEAFCATAAEIAAALTRGDVDALVDLSRSDRIVCAEVAVEYFPGCATGAALEGHGVSDSRLLVEMVDTTAYRAELDAVVGTVDPSSTDAVGDGAVRLVGVGTCGPDEPGRRSYHLAWTAVSVVGGRPERVVASFELNRVDEWRIVLWYRDTLDAWRASGVDPLGDAFCAAGRNPWGG